MGDFEAIGKAFVQHFYQCYDHGGKEALAALYPASSLMTFEGHQSQGKEAIMAKHRAMINQHHEITSIDCHPMADGGVLVVVLGKVRTEGEEKELGYNHTFVLKKEAEAFFIAHEIFRLTLHNS